MMNVLTFAAAGSQLHGLHYWDPVIDGRALREVLATESGVESVVGDNVSVLVHSWPGGLAEEDVFVLLGEQSPELDNGRIPIFICPVCGDLGCGAVTAEVEWTADTVTWRDFGWDVDYETDDEFYDSRLPAPAFVFDRQQYEAEVRAFIDTFDEVRASLPAELQPRSLGELARADRRRWWWPFG